MQSIITFNIYSDAEFKQKMYVSDSFNYKLITHNPVNQYTVEHVVKFIKTESYNRFEQSSRSDPELNNKFKRNWDIFIFWTDKNINSGLLRFFKNYIPIYACCGPNYILITKILAQQIHLSFSYHSAEDIINMYIYETGGILAESRIEIPKKFKNIEPKTSTTKKIDPSFVIFFEKRLHGWFSRDTELILEYILRNNEYKVVVELGSWLGCSTSCIIKNMHAGSDLYCFDKFQNILNSPYSIDGNKPIDNFYLETPRFETFVKNVAEFITPDKNVYPIKADVNSAPDFFRHKKIIPDVYFIDAIKGTTKLLNMLQKIFNNNPKSIVIGDDFGFGSVKNAVKIFNKKNLFLYKFSECYVISYIEQKGLSEYAKKNFFSANIFNYDLIKFHIDNDNLEQCIKLAKGVDINLPLSRYNCNSIYTYIVIKAYYDHSEKMKIFKKYLDGNFHPKKIKNILGLTYEDYMKFSDMIY